MTNNLQDFLWAPAGPFFWNGLAAVAALNAILLFHSLLHSVHRNALTFARLGWLGGCIMAMFIPWNSGFQIWSLALIVTSGAVMSILIQTRWCERPGRPIDKVLAIIRELIWHKQKVPLDGRGD